MTPLNDVNDLCNISCGNTILAFLKNPYEHWQWTGLVMSMPFPCVPARRCLVARREGILRLGLALNQPIGDF